MNAANKQRILRSGVTLAEWYERAGIRIKPRPCVFCGRPTTAVAALKNHDGESTHACPGGRCRNVRNG